MSGTREHINGVIPELEEFDPSTGHLHTCNWPQACDCAAWTYALAAQAQEQLRAAGAGPAATRNGSVGPPTRGEHRG